jgi:mono/diheme cytochrome c family protein
MRARQWKVLAIATVAAMGMTACGGDTAEDAAEQPVTETGVEDQAQETGAMAANLPEGVTQEQFQEGQQLFTGQGACHACHGPQATGTQLAPDLTDAEWINVSGRNYDEIVQLIHTGVPQPQEHPGPMPPLGGANLNDQQVEALAAYVVGISEG